MTYQRFEDLPVWQAAIQPAVRAYDLTGTADFRGHGSLRDQIERASVSVSSNIAEEFERGTTAELLAFLDIARGSAGGVRSMLRLLEQLSTFKNLKFEIISRGQFETTSRLGGHAPELRDQGPAPPHRPRPPGRRAGPLA